MTTVAPSLVRKKWCIFNTRNYAWKSYFWDGQWAWWGRKYSYAGDERAIHWPKAIRKLIRLAIIFHELAWLAMVFFPFCPSEYCAVALLPFKWRKLFSFITKHEVSSAALCISKVCVFQFSVLLQCCTERDRQVYRLTRTDAQRESAAAVQCIIHYI